jgi:hypothetical protein
MNGREILDLFTDVLIVFIGVKLASTIPIFLIVPGVVGTLRYMPRRWAKG